MPVLVQIIVWRRSGNKPLSEPMVVYFINASLGIDELSIPLTTYQEQIHKWLFMSFLSSGVIDSMFAGCKV